MQKTHHGSCLCEQVSFRVNGPLRPVLMCHCRQCRKTSGHYWAATNAMRTDLEMINDQGLRWFDSSDKATRGFCQNCGASVFWHWHGSDTISIAAGSLDDTVELQTEGHIFTGLKGSYYHLPEQEHARPTDQDEEIV